MKRKLNSKAESLLKATASTQMFILTTFTIESTPLLALLAFTFGLNIYLLLKY